MYSPLPHMKLDGSSCDLAVVGGGGGGGAEAAETDFGNPSTYILISVNIRW